MSLSAGTAIENLPFTSVVVLKEPSSKMAICQSDVVSFFTFYGTRNSSRLPKANNSNKEKNDGIIVF